jgi:hypothetical protein
LITRCYNLETALTEIETEQLVGASNIVVNLEWWTGLSVAQQDAYRVRAEGAGVTLLADDALSRHYVEVRGPDDSPSMSSERPV